LRSVHFGGSPRETALLRDRQKGLQRGNVHKNGLF
jgi:hypothetical protein